MASEYIRWIGHSSDYRTNRWQLTCPRCGHSFSPATTMFARQILHCERAKCNAEIYVDYNDQIVKLAL